MAIQYIDDGAPDGASFGKDSTRPIGFYGTTTASRPAFTNTSTATTSGFSTTWGNSIQALLNEIRGHLTTLGLIGD